MYRLARSKGRRKQPTSRPTKQRNVLLTNNEIAKLAARYEAGDPVKEIAADFGVHRSTVTRHAQNHAAKRKNE
jgi:DNA-binding MarR family transcriptional regulator